MIVSQKTRLKILWAVLLFLVAMLITGLAYTQIVTRSDETVNVTDSLTDMAFFAAKDLKVQVQSTDDIFAVGGDVTITQTLADHLLLAGGTVTLNDVKLKDLIMAGGRIDLVKGEIADDIIAAAEDLDIEPSFTLGGSAMFAAETLNIATPIGGDLRAAAETLSLSSNVGGDALLYGETINIGPNVRIGGNLRYRAEDFEMDPTAAVVGTVTKLEKEDAPDEFEKWGKKAVGIIVFFALSAIIGIAILVAVSAAIFPGLMNGSANMIGTKPLQTLGIGFLVVIVGPVLLMMLFASVLGIPLALLLGAFYLVAAPLALAASTYFVGMKGRELIQKKTDENPPLGTRIMWSLLATFALLIVGLIPLIGGLIWLIAYVIGMGAVVVRGGTALARSTT